MQAMNAMMGGGADPYGFGQQQSATPTINVTPVIKLVGGNDYSKNDGTPQENMSNAQTEGGQPDMTFSNLVIPKMTGGRTESQNPTSNKQSGKEKTLLGGLSDFGKLVINKIM